MAFETESEKFDLRARTRAQLKSFKCARAQLKSLKCARARSYLFELEKFRRFPSQCHLGNIKKEKKKYDSTFGTETVYFIGQALKSEYEIIPPRKGKKNMVNPQRPVSYTHLTLPTIYSV